MSDMENMLRRVLEEQLQPIRQELRQINLRLTTLEDGQQKLHQDFVIIKRRYHYQEGFESPLGRCS